MVLLGSQAHRSNFRHVFVSLTGGGAAQMSLVENDLEVKLLGGRNGARSIPVFVRLVIHLLAARPQIVHTHGAEANFVGILAAGLLRIPVRISEEIGIPGHSWLGRAAFRTIHRLASVVVAVSEATKESLVNAREVPDRKCLVIESPAGLLSFPEARAKPSSLPVVAFVGRLEPVKNPLTLLDAIAIMKADGHYVRLLVVGDGSLKQRMTEKISDLGLKDQVVLAGFRPNPFEIVREASVFVQPSLSEGMSMALVEAMSMGLPPIVSPVGGGREIVDDGVSGWFFSRLDPEGIAVRLSEIIGLGASKLKQVGDVARKTVSSRFKPEAYVQELDSLYESCLRVSIGK